MFCLHHHSFPYKGLTSCPLRSEPGLELKGRIPPLGIPRETVVVPVSRVHAQVKGLPDLHYRTPTPRSQVALTCRKSWLSSHCLKQEPDACPVECFVPEIGTSVPWLAQGGGGAGSSTFSVSQVLLFSTLPSLVLPILRI